MQKRAASGREGRWWQLGMESGGGDVDQGAEIRLNVLGGKKRRKRTF